jgi:hypothetical protein
MVPKPVGLALSREEAHAMCVQYAAYRLRRQINTDADEQPTPDVLKCCAFFETFPGLVHDT